jgi:hypothetical protein
VVGPDGVWTEERRKTPHKPARTQPLDERKRQTTATQTPLEAAVAAYAARDARLAEAARANRAAYQAAAAVAVADLQALLAAHLAPQTLEVLAGEYGHDHYHADIDYTAADRPRVRARLAFSYRAQRYTIQREDPAYSDQELLITRCGRSSRTCSPDDLWDTILDYLAPDPPTQPDFDDEDADDIPY